MLLPPLVSTQAAAMITVVADGARCVVNFFSATFGTPLATWAQCAPGDRIDSPMTLDALGETLVLVTHNGTVVAVDVRLATVGTQLWSLWLGAPASWSPPLVVGAFVWARTDDNTTYAVSMTPPHVVTAAVSTVTCHGAPDVVTSPVSLYSSLEGIVIASSAAGCGVAFNASGVLAVAPFGDAPLDFSRALAPVVDLASARMFFATRDRTVCCLVATIVTPCWPCITLTAGGGDLAPGLALTPATKAYHDGMLYAVDASGTLHAISTITSVAFSSDLIGSGVATAPIVVPNALGANVNLLVAVTTSGVVTALYVGDAQVNADDSSDDDGQGTGGISWTYQLSLLTAGAGNASGALVNVAGFAIRDDGRLLVPLMDGSLAVVGPQHAAPNTATQQTVIIVVTVVSVACAIAIGVTVWCACMKRRRARLAALAYRESLAEAAAMGDGGGDDDRGDSYTLMGSVEVDSHHSSHELVRRHTSVGAIN